MSISTATQQTNACAQPGALSLLWRDKPLESTRQVTACSHGAHDRPVSELTGVARVNRYHRAFDELGSSPTRKGSNLRDVMDFFLR